MKTMQPVNPVQIISDFLKSGLGMDMMQRLAAINRTIELGAINEISFFLGRDGFRARNKNGCEEAATAYDIYDVSVTQSSAETVEGDAETSFACFISQRSQTQTR
jgi:hypothetical protein